METNISLVEQNFGPPAHLFEQCLNKWDYLVEGILDPKDQLNGYPTHMGKTSSDILARKAKLTALMLELTEQGFRMQQDPLMEASTTTQVGSFTTFAYSMVRRALPRLIALDLVSVQPILQPTAKIFFFDILRDHSGEADDATRVDVKADFNSAYAVGSEAGTVAQMKFSVSSVNVSAVSKKLKALATIESEQDLKAYYGMDGMQELMAAMGDELVREINYMVVADLFSGATAGNVNFTKAIPDGYDMINTKAYERTLYDKIIDASNNINKLRYRKPNWVYGGVDEIARIEKLEEFKISPEASDNDLSIGRHYLGTINKRMDVFCDPWSPQTDKLLIGYKGTSWLETGYVYSPYIPIYVTPLFIDPNDFTPRRGIMSRFAKTMVVGDYYATVTFI